MIFWSVIIGILIGFSITALVILIWIIVESRSSQETYVMSMEHNCDDFLICDEGNPEKPFKCTKCKKRF